jgi:hypothetical protein
MSVQRVSRSGCRGVCETCVSLSRVLRALCVRVLEELRKWSSLVLVVCVFVDGSATITCSFNARLRLHALSATSIVNQPSLDFTSKLVNVLIAT